MDVRQRHLLIALLIGLSSLLTVAAAPATDHTVAYRLSPELENGVLKALDIEVRYRADGAGRGDFEWIRSWAGDTHLWRWAKDFKVQGAQSVQDLGEGRWRIVAKPGAALVIRYDVRSAFDHDPSVADENAQPLPIVRPNWFYAVGETLFGAPKERDKDPATFDWRGAPQGFTFASDLEHLAGPGRIAARPGTVADIQESIALGGTDVHVSGSLEAASRVRVASRGDYKFTAADFDRLARRIIDTERAFWGDGPKAPFLVTLAPLQARPPSRSFSGTGRTDAFAIWYDTGASLDDAKWLLAHEYFHTWNSRQLGGLRDGDAVEPLGYWFSEGFTDYYARRMTLASGLWTLQDFADAWNGALKAYDLSSARTTPNRDIPARFWTDPEIKQLPYWRGSLLAAALDARLRQDGAQKGGLDALLRDQRAAVAAKVKAPDSDASLEFREILKARRPDLDALVEGVVERGDPMTLPADVFAPCFQVETKPTPTFDRGFDIGATLKNDHKVVGLEPGGPAERAGLRMGDRIGIDEMMTPDPQVARRYVVHEPGGGAHVVTYLPLGPAAQLQQISVTPGLDARQRDACLRLYGGRSETLAFRP